MVDEKITPTLNPRSNGWILTIIFMLAGIGFLLSFTQLYAYSGRNTPLTGSAWLCGSSDVLEYGCGDVFASRYGKFLGIPWPFYGSLYFLSVIVWIALFRRDTFNIFFGALMAGGFIISATLLYILFALLPGLCRWCLLIHITNGLMILTAVVGLVLNRKELSFSLADPRLAKAFLVLFIMVTLGTSSIGFYFYSENQKLKSAYLKMRLDPTYQQCKYYSEKQVQLDIRPDDHVLGSKNAPVQIVVYKDAQCEYCHQTWKILSDLYKKINTDGQNNMMIVVRHYPLSSRCNPKVKNNTHSYACPAAKAIEAAGVVGGEEAFWKYHQLLHERQADLDQAPYLQIAKQMGLLEQSFTTAMRDPKIQDKIKRESIQLEALGYHGIPAVFINGRYVDGWQVEGFMENIVREELKKAGITPPPTTSPSTLPTTQTSGR